MKLKPRTTLQQLCKLDEERGESYVRELEMTVDAHLSGGRSIQFWTDASLYCIEEAILYVHNAGLVEKAKAITDRWNQIKAYIQLGPAAAAAAAAAAGPAGPTGPVVAPAVTNNQFDQYRLDQLIPLLQRFPTTAYLVVTGDRGIEDIKVEVHDSEGTSWFSPIAPDSELPLDQWTGEER